MDFVEHLPNELLEKIVRSLSVQDLLNCSLVSKSWRINFNMDIAWRDHCLARRFLPETIDALDAKFMDGSSTESPLPNIDSICRWRKIFSWHNRLKNNWINRNYVRYNLSVKKCESPVFCLDSDGTKVVSGHEDATVNIWKISGEPSHSHKFSAALSSIPVICIRVWEDYIVLLQRKLLQIYKNCGVQGYILKDAKTFELGGDKMSLIDKINILGDSFDYWYKECLRVAENVQFELPSLLFEVMEGLVFTTIRGSDDLGVWRLDGTPRASLAGFRSIRRITAFGGKVFIVSDSGDTVLSEYSIEKNESTVTLRVPGWKKIVVSEEFFIAVPNRMDTTLKRMWVWDRKYTSVRTKQLSFGQVSIAPAGPLVIYSENSSVTVWDPRQDKVVNKFSAGALIGFIKPAFSTLLVMFMNAAVHVWDYMEGKRLYRIYSELEWHGDFRDQLWLNSSLIVAGGVNRQIELLYFLDS